MRAHDARTRGRGAAQLFQQLVPDDKLRYRNAVEAYRVWRDAQNAAAVAGADDNASVAAAGSDDE